MIPQSSGPIAMRFVDSHNHLHAASLQTHRARILADLASANVSAVVLNGTSESDWSDVAAFCTPKSVTPTAAVETPISLYPSFGLHPWNAGNRTPDWERLLMLQLEAYPHAGIGEIGLDRWMLDRARSDDPRLIGLRRAPLEEQIDVFRLQLSLAAEQNRAASIHCLDAFGPLYDVLRSTPRPKRGFLLHAYSGSAELARSFGKLGAYFSFNGAFLDPRKFKLRALYAKIPSERLLIESDAPSMRMPAEFHNFGPAAAAPIFNLPISPAGEMLNHPANIVRTYFALAELRETDVASLARQVAENFNRLFGVDGAS